MNSEYLTQPFSDTLETDLGMVQADFDTVNAVLGDLGMHSVGRHSEENKRKVILENWKSLQEHRSEIDQ